MAGELGLLVRGGGKTATAGLAAAWEEYLGGLPGDRQTYVVLDWMGQPLAVIRNTEVIVVPFDQVSADFARAEGEGDLSLRWWRGAHWDFFEGECASLGIEANEQMQVVCQRFELLWPVSGSGANVGSAGV
jgi:uncharacterized protein YhfF